MGNLLGVLWIYLQQFDVWSGRLVYCRFHSGLTIFSSIAMYLWSLAAAVYLYTSLVVRRQDLADRMHIPFHIICWGIPRKMQFYTVSSILTLSNWLRRPSFFNFKVCMHTNVMVYYTVTHWILVKQFVLWDSPLSFFQMSQSLPNLYTHRHMHFGFMLKMEVPCASPCP